MPSCSSVPGSAGFQPAKRNPAGKMPALPGKASLFTNTLLKLQSVTSVEMKLAN